MNTQVGWIVCYNPVCDGERRILSLFHDGWLIVGVDWFTIKEKIQKFKAKL